MADEMKFLAVFVVSVIAGIAGGLYLPWYSLLGLTVIVFVIWVFIVINLDVDRKSGPVRMGVVTGFPVMVSVWWIVFLIAIRLRA